jgi:hypothetical protein
LVAAGGLDGLGEVVADFSVVTETLGSEVELSVCFDAVASGEASGAGVDSSSWARANGATAITTATKAKVDNFIGFVLFLWMCQRKLWRRPKDCRLGGRTLFCRAIVRQGPFGRRRISPRHFGRKTPWL